MQRVQHDLLPGGVARRYLVTEFDVVEADGVLRPVVPVVGRARVAVDRGRGSRLSWPTWNECVQGEINVGTNGKLLFGGTQLAMVKVYFLRSFLDVRLIFSRQNHGPYKRYAL